MGQRHCKGSGNSMGLRRKLGTLTFLLRHECFVADEWWPLCPADCMRENHMKGSWRLLGVERLQHWHKVGASFFLSCAIDRCSSILLPKTEQIHSRTDEVVLMVCCSAVAASISCKSSIQEMKRPKGRIRASGRKDIQGLIVQGNSSSWYQ